MSLYPLHAINLNILQVLGRSDIFLYLEVLKRIVGLIPVVIGIFYGIYFMLLISIFTSIIGLYLNTWYTGKALKYTFWKQIKDITPSYMTAFIIALSVYFLKYISLPFYVILAIQLVVGVITGCVVSQLLNSEEYIELKLILIKILKKNK